MMNVELKRLAHLLNDMQQQSGHSPEIATDFDVVLLICDLLTLTRYQIDKSISLEVEAAQPFIAHLPESTLRQALLNLVLNAAQALEHSPAGHICIKVFQSGPNLTIQVLDDGTGFSQTMLSGTRPSRPCTTGQGLAMTQQFINTMNGSVKLSNRVPHGGCVTILLPQQNSSGDHFA
jgi:signal transduction histidine kinase